MPPKYKEPLNSQTLNIKITPNSQNILDIKNKNMIGKKNIVIAKSIFTMYDPNNPHVQHPLTSRHDFPESRNCVIVD